MPYRARLAANCLLGMSFVQVIPTPISPKMVVSPLIDLRTNVSINSYTLFKTAFTRYASTF